MSELAGRLGLRSHELPCVSWDEDGGSVQSPSRRRQCRLVSPRLKGPGRPVALACRGSSSPRRDAATVMRDDLGAAQRSCCLWNLLLPTEKSVGLYARLGKTERIQEWRSSEQLVRHDER